MIRYYIIGLTMLLALLMSATARPADAADNLRSMGSGAQSVERSEHLREATNGSTFIVNNSGDAGDFDTNDEVCETGDGNGVCTLRAAMEEADADNDHDIIRFNFTTPVVIQPLSLLPRIFTPITIDAVTGNPSTCPTASAPANLLVTISGENVGGGSGIYLSGDADSSVIRGLHITDFDDGIFIHGTEWLLGFRANYDTDIVCNHIDNITFRGVYLVGANGTRIGIENDLSSRNVLSDSRYGIYSDNWTGSNGGSIEIAENYIGTTVDGIGDDGNNLQGIVIFDQEPGSSDVRS